MRDRVRQSENSHDSIGLVVLGSDVNTEFFVVPDVESKNPISIRISVHSDI